MRGKAGFRQMEADEDGFHIGPHRAREIAVELGERHIVRRVGDGAVKGDVAREEGRKVRMIGTLAAFAQEMPKTF